jgi:alkanesulfonate monooxygenase SsuD/methylene tetrahydromethanopterin reductase-like flavin-dependent oxidoreductase (luciferase family)
MTTRLGFQIPNFSFPGVPTTGLFEQVATIASRAESAGFDTLFVMDHFYQLRSASSYAFSTWKT